MTSAAAELERASPPVKESVFARGSQLVEFLLVGGATPLLFPVAWLLRSTLGLDTAELAVGFVAFHAAYVINDPHFSVTYLLFYKDVRRRAFSRTVGPLQRARYWLAGLLVPLALGGWASFALATGSAKALGAMLQLMFLLVGWHYVKQGFGVLAVLSARRGVVLSPGERLVFLAHCFAGWAYAWASPFDPGKTVAEKGVIFATVAHPHWLEPVTGLAFLVSTLLLLVMLGRKWRSERRLPPPIPLSGFLITVWLWTVFSSLDPLMVYVIPALHSLQYLYFVWLMKRNEALAEEGPPAFGRPVSVRLGILATSALALGYVLFRGGPDFLDDARALSLGGDVAALSDLGATPYAAALFAFVNIHHYFMDHVIWRRENLDTRYLTSTAPRTAGTPT